jgi:hypothetical protein
MDACRDRRMSMLLCASSALTLGVILYLAFRPWTFEAAGWIGLHERPGWLLDGLKAPNWIRFNLPDALWLYAFLVALTAFWVDSSGRLVPAGQPWIVGAAILALGHELGQAVGVTNGTFDFADIAAYMLGILAAFLTWKRQTEKEQ